MSWKSSRLSRKHSIWNLKGSLSVYKVLIPGWISIIFTWYISITSQNSCILNWKRSHSFNFKSRSWKTILKFNWLHYSTKTCKKQKLDDDWSHDPLLIHSYNIIFSYFHLVFSSFCWSKSDKDPLEIQTCRSLHLFVSAYLDNWVRLLAWKRKRWVLQLP